VNRCTFVSSAAMNTSWLFLPDHRTSPVRWSFWENQMQQDYEDKSEVSQEGPKPVLDANRARQGVVGHNVRYVLFFGLAGVLIAFLLIAVFMNKMP
jgi:hypothetical protein